LCCVLSPRPPTLPLFPYTTLFRSRRAALEPGPRLGAARRRQPDPLAAGLARGLGRAALLRAVRERTPPATVVRRHGPPGGGGPRSEEHTSELQSQSNLVCRLLPEK